MAGLETRPPSFKIPKMEFVIWLAASEGGYDDKGILSSEKRDYRS